MLDDTRSALSAAVAAALAGADSYQAAAEALLEAARGDPALYAELVGPFEGQAARQAVYATARDQRAVIWRRPTEPDARAAALARGVARTLLDFRLPTGQRLGDATRDDVTAAAHHYREKADDMAWKARWLDAVAAKTPSRKRVGQALDDAALAKLQQETSE